MTRPGNKFSAVATYTILAALQRGISFLILPFITHAMTPSEYGAASILAAGSLLLTALLANPPAVLIPRAAARGEENGDAHLRLIGIYCYLVLPIFAALLAAGVTLFAPNILGVPGYIWGIELVAIGLQPLASTFALSVLQARENLRGFALVSLASVATSAGLKLVFVVVLQKGVLGWALSDLFTASVAAILAIALVRLPRVRVTRDHFRYVLNFSVPLVPHSISLWALMFLSRPAMATVAPLDQVGLFSFALNLAQLAGLILTEANRGVLVHYAREKFPSPSDEMVGIVKWQLIAAVVAPTIVGCGVAAAGPWLFAESFWPAFSTTGVLLVAQVGLGLYFIPMNYLTQSAGITRYSAIASGAGAAVLFGGILLLGRSYGADGVAFATAVGYFVMFLTAAALVAVHRLNIAWRTWFSAWPTVLLAASSLGLAIEALRLPAASSHGRHFVVLSMSLCLLAVALLKVRGPKYSLAEHTNSDREV